jgi:hypothetical protein
LLLRLPRQLRIRVRNFSRSSDFLDGLRQAMGCDELEERILQNVFGVARIRDSPSNEIARTPTLARDGFGNAIILFSHHRIRGQRGIHTGEDESQTEIL